MLDRVAVSDDGGFKTRCESPLEGAEQCARAVHPWE